MFNCYEANGLVHKSIEQCNLQLCLIILLTVLVTGARMMYLLDSSSQEKAISIATNLDATLADCNPKVCPFEIFVKCYVNTSSHILI